MMYKFSKLDASTLEDMRIDPIATGKQLRKYRREHNLTQEDLSELFDLWGCSVTRNTVSYWESGKRNISADKVAFLADFYGCSISELIITCRRSRNLGKRD